MGHVSSRIDDQCLSSFAEGFREFLSITLPRCYFGGPQGDREQYSIH